MAENLTEQTDRHIENCDVCGDGEGVCLTGYLLAVREQSDDSADTEVKSE